MRIFISYIVARPTRKVWRYQSCNPKP